MARSPPIAGSLSNGYASLKAHSGFSRRLLPASVGNPYDKGKE